MRKPGPSGTYVFARVPVRRQIAVIGFLRGELSSLAMCDEVKARPFAQGGRRERLAVRGAQRFSPRKSTVALLIARPARVAEPAIFSSAGASRRPINHVRDRVL
jgi:hypothetical protein